MNLSDVFVKEGYELKAIVDQPYYGENRILAVLKTTSTCTPYVVACGYDIYDGTWAAGIYCCTLGGALTVLKDKI